MADIRDSPAAYGDSSAALWLKIAVAFQAYAGITETGDAKTSAPRYGDTQGNILRAAHALQQA